MNEWKEEEEEVIRGVVSEFQKIVGCTRNLLGAQSNFHS